jgi:uncharacterized protein (TIGR00297 family)
VAIFCQGHIWCLRARFCIAGLADAATSYSFSFEMSYLPQYPAIVLTHPAEKVAAFAALTMVFAVLGRIVRGVTTGGAVAGAAVCFALLWVAGLAGFAGLLTVFVLTWIATRFGYKHKQRLGTAEARTGRNALQVLANLGSSAGCAVLYATVWPDRRFLIAMAAALAEAAADTVSSEMGQALGGTPRLITTWKKVAPGTDGAVTLPGTMDGATAAIAVALVFALSRILSWRSFAVCAGAGVAGMIFDSFLGATLERSRLLGNNAVNLASTIVAAGLAFLLS